MCSLHPFEGDVSLADLLSQSLHRRMFTVREGHEQAGERCSAAHERGKSSEWSGKKHRRDRE